MPFRGLPHARPAKGFPPVTHSSPTTLRLAPAARRSGHRRCARRAAASGPAGRAVQPVRAAGGDGGGTDRTGRRGAACRDGRRSRGVLDTGGGDRRSGDRPRAVGCAVPHRSATHAARKGPAGPAGGDSARRRPHGPALGGRRRPRPAAPERGHRRRAPSRPDRPVPSADLLHPGPAGPSPPAAGRHRRLYRPGPTRRRCRAAGVRRRNRPDPGLRSRAPGAAGPDAGGRGRHRSGGVPAGAAPGR